MFVDDDKTAWITQSFHIGNRIHTFEGRQHHGMFEFQFMLLDGFTGFVTFINKHFTSFHLADLGIGDPFYVSMAEFGFKHAFGITDTPQSEVSNIRFAGYKGDGNLMPYAFTF